MKSPANRRPYGTVAGLTALLFSICCSLAVAQSLAEVAKKEQDRRKSTKATPNKVYTNKDLPQGAQAPPAAPVDPAAPGQPPGQAAQAPPAQPPAAPQPPGEVKDEKWWRDRITAVRSELQRSQLFLEALQSRVNALSTDYVNRDDPAQRAVIATDRQKALAEMDRVRADIERLKKEIADIEEEARKAGVPPGWLR
jgi:hypothetical protein